MARSVCTIDGCGRPINGHGYCLLHYRRHIRQHGPFPARETTAVEWLTATVANAATDECIDWPLATLNGYGVLSQGGRTWKASRLACHLANGPAPATGIHAAHACGRPVCVNPRHLRWATPKENSADQLIHGTTIRGRAAGTKLTAADVIEIRSMVAAGHSQADAVRRFGVGANQVSRIVRGLRWTWLTDSPASPLPDSRNRMHPEAAA